MLFSAVDGRPNLKGGAHRVEMLPTTSHVYFGAGYSDCFCGLSRSPQDEIIRRTEHACFRAGSGHGHGPVPGAGPWGFQPEEIFS